MDWDEIQNHIYYGQPRGCAPTAAVLLLLLTLLLGGCKHIEYVPIETTHTIEHHHTDSVRQVDSIFKNKETIIMQLDSEAMAQYGIRLQAAEKAWLVRTAELEKQLQKLQHTKTDTLLKVDSVQVPYPVEIVKTKTNYGGWWAFAGLLLSVIVAIISYFLIRYKTHK